MEAVDKTVIPIHRPGMREEMFFFLSGIVVSIPLTLSANVFSNQLCVLLPLLYADICATAIFAPLIEEFAKVYPLFYRHGETQRSIFTLGFLVGLGFGLTEFFLYVLQGAPVLLRLPGIFFHASSTSVTAYGIAIKRYVPFYLIAVSLHLAYNFFTFLGLFWLIGGPAAMLTVFYLSWHLYGKTSEKVVV